MGTRKLVAVAAAALAVATGCGKSDGSGGGGDGGGSADPTSIASADEVLKVVDKGFAVYRRGASDTSPAKGVSYGFVIENVSDQVAVTVRVATEFTDDAGKVMPDVTGGAEFSVVLPGQRIGAGGRAIYEGETIPDDMNVTITLIASLDTPDGERHLKAPGSYAELTTGTPVAGEKESYLQPYTVDVTNTYDAPIKPRATMVARDAEGKIVGGAVGKVPAQEIQPGATAPVEVDRDASSPKLQAATVECYADPGLGKVIVSKPVWQVL